jgi:hypothetical protein
MSDYFLKNRIKEYDEFIKTALENNYSILPHSEFYKLAKTKQLEGKKIMLIRHDIDSDPHYCMQWLKVEKKYGIRTSYYFRLCTINIEIMQKVHDYGSDCGYHYEEIADFAKKNILKNRIEVEQQMDKIRELFTQNFSDLENKIGFKIKSIASHGDFVNKVLNLNNYVLVNTDLLQKNKIDFECYQSEFVSNYSINVSDCVYPDLYKQRISPIDAIQKELPIIHVLIHPRHWRANWYWNTLENIKRIVEGIRYKSA